MQNKLGKERRWRHTRIWDRERGRQSKRNWGMILVRKKKDIKGWVEKKSELLRE